MRRRLKVEDCLWVRSPNSEHPIFMPITRALEARGAKTFSLQIKKEPESLAKLKDLLWKSDAHVILHGLLPWELKTIQPILKDRKNFSMLLIDWWTSAWWYTRNAEFLLFKLYNGIAIRKGLTPFISTGKPPLLSPPEMMIPFHLAGAALRPVALLTCPFREWLQRQRRELDNRDPDRLLYFPISVNSAENLPLRSPAPDEYDFSNTGSTYGIWLTRDAYAPARYDFANIYADRGRLVDGAAKMPGQPYKIFDRRRHPRLSWDEYCRVVHRSRYAIATGGLQEASIPKFLEYVALGTPVLGRPLPYEYPLLRSCIFNVDTRNGIPGNMKAKLDEALDMQPRLRENALAIREKIFQIYDPQRIIDLLQSQFDGRAIPSNYIQPMQS